MSHFEGFLVLLVKLRVYNSASQTVVHRPLVICSRSPCGQQAALEKKALQQLYQILKE
jgi:hypothetical protein